MADINNLVWDSMHREVSNNVILEIEKYFGANFPKDFKKCVVINHGGYPDLDTFDFENHKDAVFSRLLSFDKQKQTYILNVYNAIKDRLIDNIFPFASDPFGNYLCFDYRNGKNESPTIVYWNHEEAFENPDSAIHPVCDTFTELLSKLYNPEE